MTAKVYTTKLGAGQGILEETRILLRLWESGMDGEMLQRVALESGLFPTMTARRLRNLIREGFVPRYLISDGKPAIFLKKLMSKWTNREFEQLLFLYTCRLHDVLADYIREVYWSSYVSGKDQITVDDARSFVKRANRDGKTATKWSEKMVERVSSYLNGACADFGLLDINRGGTRNILPFRIEPRVAVYLAYDLHFSGLGDNRVLSHPDWELFGLNRDDVLDELKRLALKGWFIVQTGGGVVRIGWQYNSMEELVNALTRR
jgi:hypothetical protein